MLAIARDPGAARRRRPRPAATVSIPPCSSGGYAVTGQGAVRVPGNHRPATREGWPGRVPKPQGPAAGYGVMRYARGSKRRNVKELLRTLAAAHANTAGAGRTGVFHVRARVSVRYSGPEKGKSPREIISTAAIAGHRESRRFVRRTPWPSRIQVYNSDSRSVVIIVIGLVILLAAVAAVAGVLSNDGSGHGLAHGFAVLTREGLRSACALDTAWPVRRPARDGGRQ